VPDGTLVNPFLNAKDALSGLPWDLLDGLGVAAGQIQPGMVSEIHVLPCISQVTILLSGELTVIMKDAGNADPPYRLDLKIQTSEGDSGFGSAAVINEPGTFFQLDNSNGQEPANVFYLTSPGYLYEPGASAGSDPVYDDAIVLGRDWNRLAEQGWMPPELSDPARSAQARHRALGRRSRLKPDQDS
jgi:hypothetical protein